MGVLKKIGKALIAVVIVSVLVVSFSVCIGAGTTTKTVTTTTSTTTEYQVTSYTPIAKDGAVYLKVTVKGEPRSLELLLSNPEGNTVGKDFIPEEDLVDGVESVELQMADYGTTPEAGTYTLYIFDFITDEFIYSKNITFEGGAKISIKNADFETTYFFW
ncbi:hypothetical protein A3L12_04945 [Thermococcus sp. P6]|nr:hypothetical protein A3L12_04945 [Thermococcus sp. P6]